MRIFLTNDDGYLSYGILGLAEKLSKKHDVTVVAPHNPQSAAGHALTLHKPLWIKHFDDLTKKHGAEIFSCSGKPADCTTLGVDEVLKERPDLVISGINIGGNLGTDIIYSGTVSGALEAAMKGYKAIAVSLNSFELDNMDTAIQFIDEFVDYYPVETIGKEHILNINVPNLPYSELKGIKVVEQGITSYSDTVTKGKDPFGNDFYWIGGKKEKAEEGMRDVNAIDMGYVTLTPITYMMTDKTGLKEIEENIKGFKTER